jgi:hypothetical protein
MDLESWIKDTWIKDTPEWVQKSIEYARQMGYILGRGRNLHLGNIRDGDFEIFNFSYLDTDGVICYPYLKIVGKHIESVNFKKKITEFSEFKNTLDGIIKDYKKLQIEIKIKEAERDFE